MADEPTLLVKDEVSGHAARDEGARGSLAEIGFEGDRTHGSSCVKGEGLWRGQGVHEDLA